MKEKLILTYSLALINLIDERPTILENFESFIELVDINDNLKKILVLKSINWYIKDKILEEILNKENYLPIFKNFIRYLIKINRVELYYKIFLETKRLLDVRNNVYYGKIEGVEDLIDLKSKEKFCEILKKTINGDIRLSYKQNKRIIAGYKICLKDYQLDVTLNKQLQKLLNQSVNNKV